MGERARDFVTDEQELPCGYAPRTIQYSLASDTLFVGCKDGTITVVQGLAGDELQGPTLKESLGYCSLSARDPEDENNRSSSVRALAEWCPGWLLIGRADGHIHLLHWAEAIKDGGASGLIPVWGPAQSGIADRVAYLEWLNREWLLLSFQHQGSRVIHCGEQPPGTSVAQWVQGAFSEAQDRRSLPLLKNVVCSISINVQNRWLHISKDGSVWDTTLARTGKFSTTQIHQFWKEIPGFVSDFAYVKKPYTPARRESSSFDYREEQSQGVYISTDSGVYLVRWGRGNPRPQRIALPGVERMCLAITYFADDENQYLWVSDSAGDAHLFWDSPGTSSPEWQRSGIRHDASQVNLAFSSWRKLGGHFVVSQARRNNVVVISRYGSDPITIQSDRQLLHRGTLEDLRKAVVRNLDAEADTWESETLLAELFEFLGEAPDNMKDLREFLRNPDAQLAGHILEDLKNPERSGRAIELWTYALMGIVHHYQGSLPEKESLYLGIIRWLRAISELALSSPKQQARVLDVVQDQTVLVRKWGVFGGSLSQWRTTAVPWSVLAKQERSDILDRYAYQSLLFQRQVDLEHEDSRSRRQGPACDLRTLRAADGRYIIAVSWVRGGIEIHQLAPVPDREGRYSLDLCVVLRPEMEGGSYRLSATNVGKSESPPALKDLDFGHCRAFVLGTLPGASPVHYLLASPAQPTGKGGKNNPFMLWKLDLSGDRVRVGRHLADAVTPLECEPEADESIYSLLEVEPGLIVAGLRGHRGIAQVALLRIESEPLTMCCLEPVKLTAPSPEGKSIARNSVWTLAQDRSSAEENRPHIVFAGCGDGQVWKLTIPRRRHSGRIPMTPTSIGRLGAPVWALACRTNTSGPSPVRRVFVGGADGTIVAWQQLPGKDKPFTPVWATWEGDGPISRIHPFQSADAADWDFPMILAVTQQGRAILFADQPKVDSTGRSEAHRRPRVPGERCGRILLEASAFASELETELLPLELNPPFARLISATNDGRIQVHCLMYPLHLRERKEQYKDLVATWLKMVCEPLAGDSHPAYRTYRLRIAEVAYMASPIAPQVLVRGLLEHETYSDAFDAWKHAPARHELHRQWVPRYLRPLLDLHFAWEALDKATVRRHLEMALERAWKWNDRELFVEIVTIVLNRSNHWLCNPSRREESDLQQVADVYHEILDGLERSLKRWLGSPDKAEIRTRISFAKQLTDGDTLWRVGRRTERSEAAKSILRERLTALQALLVTGDPLLALETLRAANLALIRLCRRLVEDGKRSVWFPNDPRQEIPWRALDAYVKSVSDFAAGAFHVTQRVSDSLAHEIARGFALTVCCCPSSAIRIGHWMAEADLISASARGDQAEAVLSQIRLLEELGVPVPKPALKAFHWACRGGPILDDKDVKGKHNRKVLQAARAFEDIREWISTLAWKLSSDASGIDLWAAEGHLKRLREERPAPPEEDAYLHSRTFWDKALADFCATVLVRCELPSAVPARRIQPEIVLASREIRAWCERTILDLNEHLRLHRIFLPQHTAYLADLRQLEIATNKFRVAIQSNIVLGILGHGLLEALDEHVLELEEIAQALDPILVWQHRVNGRPPLLTEDSQLRPEHFAAHLLALSQDAESIPKNLRTLQGLLDSGEAGRSGSLCELLDEFWAPRRPNVQGADTPLTAKELRFLRLVFKELEHNDRQYGPQPPPDGWPKVSLDSKITLCFPLRVECEGDNFEQGILVSTNLARLQSLRKTGLQGLIPWEHTGDVASHGTGLYLANLAASVIGWRLRISEIWEQPGWFSFELQRIHKGQ